MTNISKDLETKVLQTLEIAKNTGKIRKGTNETTKSVERGEAKLVIIASDVQPKEITMHLPVICNEKKIPFVYVQSKTELGRSSGINVGTAAACIIEPGEGRSGLEDIIKRLGSVKG
ncbi:MAG: 50S ribosomal protein L7Ae [Candidatus Aenigmatarchaeota archaeon]